MAVSRKKKPQANDGWVDVPLDQPADDGWVDVPLNPSDARAKNPYDIQQRAKEFVQETTSADILGDIGNFLTGAADKATLENLRYSPRFQEALSVAESQSPRATGAGKALGLGAMGLGTALVPGGIPAQIAIGTGMGAAQKPAESQEFLSMDDMQDRALGGATGGGLAAILGGAGKGLKAGADRLMQLAVGRNKLTPGVGSDLIKEGVVGTRDMMKGQVARKQEDIVNRMLQEVGGQTQTYPSAPVANRVSEVGRRMSVPGGTPSALDQPTLSTIAEASQDIASRGNETLEQMLRRRVAAGNRGYSNVTDEAKRGLVGDISKAEQIGYSDILKQNAPGMIPLDARYAALARARNALSKDAPLYQGWGIPGMAAKVGAGAAGFSAGGAPGAALGALLSTPAGQSVASQLLYRGGQALPTMTPAAINALVEEIVKEQRMAR